MLEDDWDGRRDLETCAEVGGFEVMVVEDVAERGTERREASPGQVKVLEAWMPYKLHSWTRIERSCVLGRHMVLVET